MSRQERTAKRTKQAAQEADAIVKKAIKCKECGGKGERVNGEIFCEHEATCSKAPKPDKEEKPVVKRRGRKASEGNDADRVLAVRVKELRDNGMAWWKVAHTLSLPGSADNVAAGKSGAALARRLYSQYCGSYAHTGTPRKAREERTAGNSGTQTERKERIRTGGHVIPLDTPDAEVEAMLKGKNIGWFVNLSNLDGKGDHYMEQSAEVHPNFCRSEISEKTGERVVRFKECEYTSRGAVATVTRTVRLSAIHTVR